MEVHEGDYDFHLNGNFVTLEYKKVWEVAIVINWHFYQNIQQFSRVKGCQIFNPDNPHCDIVAYLQNDNCSYIVKECFENGRLIHLLLS